MQQNYQIKLVVIASENYFKKVKAMNLTKSIKLNIIK